MRLGFDLDGVICNIAKAMVDHINTKFNLDYDVDVFYHFDLSRNKYTNSPGVDKQIVYSVYKNVILNNDALLELLPYPEAIRSLHLLSKAGHEIFIITARQITAKDVTVLWLRRHGIPFDGVHVVGPNGKGSYGRMLNLDFFIDDDLASLESMYRYKNRWRKGLALLTRPWNVWMNLNPEKYIRLHDWADVIRHLGIASRADIIHCA